MGLVVFIVYALANWRLASLLSREGGPWNFLFAFRHRMGVRYDESSQMYGQNVISRGLVCMWCNTVWIGTAQIIAHILFPEVAVYISAPFALSAGAIVLESIITGGQ